MKDHSQVFFEGRWRNVEGWARPRAFVGSFFEGWKPFTVDFDDFAKKVFDKGAFCSLNELSDNMVEVAKDLGGTTSSSRRWALRHKSKELEAAETLLTEKILERRVCSNVERATVIAGERKLARKKVTKLKSARQWEIKCMLYRAPVQLL